MTDAIENAIQRDQWKSARRLINAAIRRQPKNHWLLARLALTYYEERDYKRALAIGQKAKSIAPQCPLVLWEIAGAFEMLGQHEKAMAIYRRLIRRGAETLAVGDCGEGLSWSRGLVADCWYRVAGCERKLGRMTNAVRCFDLHLALRGPGCRSIYPISDVRSERRKLT